MIQDTPSAQISQKQDEHNIHMQSWEQCVLPVITTMGLWQLMHLGTECAKIRYIYIYTEIYANTYNNAVRYYKLPYIGHFSTDVKRKINRFCKFYCKNLNIKIVLTPFKVAGLFVQAVMPITSVRQLAIYQQGLRSIWKRIKSPTFLRILLIMKLVRHFITENCFEIIDSTSTWVGSFLIYNEWLLNISDFKAKPTQTFFPLKPT